MPVQIRNLLIVAHITEESGKKGSGESGNIKTTGNINLNEETKMQIIEETVEQVLEILERQKDR